MRRRPAITRPGVRAAPMELHRPSGSAVLGLALGVFTAWIWGTLPLALKILLRHVDVVTLTWVRFLTAGLLLLPLALPGALRGASRLRGLPLALLILTVAGLTGNHLAFQKGLEFISPGTAQIVIQLAPVFMLLGGMVCFGERFRPLQWLGVALLFAGLGLFFSPRFDQLLADVDGQGTGVLLIAAAALTWGLYMLGQKQLLLYLRSDAVLLCVYLIGAAALTPAATPAAALALEGPMFALLLSTGVMAVLSYAGFAAALARVEASRVGMLIALTPLFVVANVQLLSTLRPDLLEPEGLGPAGLLGAAVVVLGSMLSVLGSQDERPPA